MRVRDAFTHTYTHAHAHALATVYSSMQLNASRTRIIELYTVANASRTRIIELYTVAVYSSMHRERALMH